MRTISTMKAKKKKKKKKKWKRDFKYRYELKYNTNINTWKKIAFNNNWSKTDLSYPMQK